MGSVTNNRCLLLSLSRLLLRPNDFAQYLKKHTDSVVTREHFSFSPRMPVGDFYEERETAEVGLVLL